MFEATTTIATAAMVSADGLFDAIETQANDATSALFAVVVLAVAAVAFGVMVKARMALGAVIVTGLVAGLVLWLVVFGGTELIAKLAGEQFASPVTPASSVSSAV